MMPVRRCHPGPALGRNLGGPRTQPIDVASCLKMTDELQHLAAALGDRYAVRRELGRGGMATVYLAET